ncbi:undecaprenyldiphospho-muramoylpentapeptide beta-N-acetylglucosaminyltransferase [Aliiglaciecola sp. M165]|uniref:undecaprenyldiphospho-muramoylpentapeptide beta-N-acetylglucosaminyltransferase n=1 Tax=Aliiglaciecola sp. M165 TaxID=2593649 RepID=UPI0011804F2F|nr:undecaprenyldiphospho-muramoylpentapeptide beta-N-acetylglucosaminyltransferase [Aliiglaciecola sp. M165]TRY31929.1 undecaprenyldiphospho-muramoylpentapeptide beta-N-acetylglucosaminyltransferase [Aliiglaciecola sp. M165]
MGKTILIMAGGTGGHVFPGIAVANELKRRNWNIHWLGTSARMEAEIVPKAGFDISFVDVAGVRGNGLLRKLKAPFQLLRAVAQANAVIKKIQPDVVLGMGGFASGPGGIAAWLRGIPLAVHEQNALPGVTNKVLAKVASKVLMGFDHAFGKNTDTHKYLWVGNPVRPEFADQSVSTLQRNTRHILIVGGSLGAKVLNEYVPSALAKLDAFSVWHQTGKGNQEEVKQSYQQQIGEHVDCKVTEFIDDMAAAYRWADVIICRAGALTVAEVAMSGVAAIFVPLPHAVDDHQTVNARALCDEGAGILMPQNKLEQGDLYPVLNELLAEPKKIGEIGERAKSLAKPEATQTVADICEDLGGMAA